MPECQSNFYKCQQKRKNVGPILKMKKNREIEWKRIEKMKMKKNKKESDFSSAVG